MFDQISHTDPEHQTASVTSGFETIANNIQEVFSSLAVYRAQYQTTAINVA